MKNISYNGLMCIYGLKVNHRFVVGNKTALKNALPNYVKITLFLIIHPVISLMLDVFYLVFLSRESKIFMGSIKTLKR